MKALLALITIMLWPVIPLFWIPVHFTTDVFRKLGRLTYLLALIVWLPVAFIIFMERRLIFDHMLEMPDAVSAAGLLLLIAGSLLHIWTGALLSPRSLVGIPEIVAPEESKFVDKGPFGVVRHPTYLAHTMMFLGVFLFTGALAAGVLTIVDFAVVNTVIMPLEERELLLRFGEPYRRYMERVPRLLPRIGGQR